MKLLRALIAALSLVPTLLYSQGTEFLALSHRFEGAALKAGALKPVTPSQPKVEIGFAAPLAPNMAGGETLTEAEKKVVMDEWKSLLKEFTSTKEVSDFANDPKNKFRIVIQNWRDGYVGEFKNGWVIMNQKEVLAIAQEAKSQGASDAEALKFAALKIFSYIPHEVAHVMDEKKMEQECGFHYCKGSIQGEMVGHSVQVNVLREMKKKAKEWNAYKTTLDKTYDSMLKAADTGSLEAYVRRNYSSVSWSSEQNIKEKLKQYEESKKDLEALVEKTNKELASVTDAAEKKKLQTRIKQAGDEIKELNNDLAILKDVNTDTKTKIAAVQKYYKTRLDQLDSLARQKTKDE